MLGSWPPELFIIRSGIPWCEDKGWHPHKYEIGRVLAFLQLGLEIKLVLSTSKGQISALSGLILLTPFGIDKVFWIFRGPFTAKSYLMLTSIRKSSQSALCFNIFISTQNPYPTSEWGTHFLRGIKGIFSWLSYLKTAPYYTCHCPQMWQHVTSYPAGASHLGQHQHHIQKLHRYWSTQNTPYRVAYRDAQGWCLRSKICSTCHLVANIEPVSNKRRAGKGNHQIWVSRNYRA